MKHWKLTQWCVYATDQIRYSPDRKAVHEELRQHLDDRSEDFLAKGFSGEEAIEKTLDAMGDPAELAPLLAQIHRPFWGYAQDVCKWMFRIAAFLAILFTIWYTVNHPPNFRYSQPDDDGWYRTIAERPYPNITYVHHDTSGAVLRDSGYSLSLIKAMTVEYTDKSYEPLYFQIRVQTPFPWQRSPEIGALLWAEDSLGNRYATYLEGRSSNSNYHVYTYFLHTAPLTYVYEGEIRGLPDNGVSWVDIHYSRDGRDMVWHIDLTGGDGV